MPAPVRVRRFRFSPQPSGRDTLAVRERYLHQRRRLSDRGWIGLWVSASALMGWLFIAGFAALGR
jgi:hypothetical protein